jgi:hypothetical protein
MTKVKVEVLGAVVDGAQSGDTITIDAGSAKHLASIGYVKILDEKSTEKAKESAPKPTSTPTKARTGKAKE